MKLLLGIHFFSSVGNTHNDGSTSLQYKYTSRLILTSQAAFYWQRVMELNHKRFRSHCLAGKPIHRYGLPSILEEGKEIEPLRRSRHHGFQDR